MPRQKDKVNTVLATEGGASDSGNLYTMILLLWRSLSESSLMAFMASMVLVEGEGVSEGGLSEGKLLSS